LTRFYFYYIKEKKALDMRKMAPGILLLAFLIISALTAFQQGAFRGTVRDKNGNPLEGVKVTIVSMSYSAVKLTVRSDKKGQFIQIGLQPDYYQLRCEKDGFLPVVLEKRVPLGETIDSSFTMEEGAPTIGEPLGEKDFKRGNDLFSAGKYEEAVEAYKEAILKEPQEPIYQNNLGICYTRLERYDQAIETFQAMLKIRPQSYSANRSLGELFGLQKKYGEALPYFAKASEVSQDDPDAFYNWGACLVNTQDLDRAAAAFLKAKELKPDYAAVYYQLGMISVNQNKKEEAIRYLEKFLELAPDDAKAATAKQLLDYLKNSLTPGGFGEQR
jgi:tetratricopeptide (TPR) repeat protein